MQKRNYRVIVVVGRVGLTVIRLFRDSAHVDVFFQGSSHIPHWSTHAQINYFTSRADLAGITGFTIIALCLFCISISSVRELLLVEERRRHGASYVVLSGYSSGLIERQEMESQEQRIRRRTGSFKHPS